MRTALSIRASSVSPDLRWQRLHAQVILPRYHEGEGSAPKGVVICQIDFDRIEVHGGRRENSIGIPARVSLSLLATLPKSAYQQILEALSRTPSSSATPRQIVAWIASEVKSVPSGELTKLINTLASLYRLRSRQSGALAETIAKRRGDCRPPGYPRLQSARRYRLSGSPCCSSQLGVSRHGCL